MELLNPSPDLSKAADGTGNAVSTGPLGDGSVPPNACQIQISRANRGAITNVPAVQQGDLVSYLGQPANVRGMIGSPGAGGLIPDAKYTFALPVGTDKVLPNNGDYGGTGVPAKGVVLVGPNVTKKTDADPPMLRPKNSSPQAVFGRTHLYPRSGSGLDSGPGKRQSAQRRCNSQHQMGYVFDPAGRNYHATMRSSTRSSTRQSSRSNAHATPLL